MSSCYRIFIGLIKFYTECESVVDSKVYYDNCLFDICNVEDSKEYYCTALNSYAVECARQGVIINWKKEVSECGNLLEK